MCCVCTLCCVCVSCACVFVQVGGKTFLINHFEGPQPSTAYVTELAADDKGKLRIISTAPVDDTAAE